MAKKITGGSRNCRGGRGGRLIYIEMRIENMFIYFNITVLAECINVTLKVLHMAKIGGVGGGGGRQHISYSSDLRPIQIS